MQFFRHRNVRGRPPHPDVLTPAEWRVLEHVREGLPNAEIAVRLGLSVPTVKMHVSNMLAKLDLPDRHELATWGGEPAEASRGALARFALGAPFGWLRDGLGATWLGKAAVVGVVVGLSIGGFVAVSALNSAGGGAAPPLAEETPTATATPVATPEPTPTPLATPAPPVGTETGIEGVDGIIELFLAGAVEEIETRLVYREVACVQEPQLDDVVVCADDEEPGTLVTTFPGVGGCHGGNLRPADVPEHNPARHGPSELYSVLKHEVAPGEEQFMIMLTPDDASPSVAGYWVIVAEGMITMWGGGCNPLDQFAPHVGGEVILHGPAMTNGTP